MGRNELRALRQLLNDDRDDWDELVASYLVLRKAIVTNKPMTQKDRDRVAAYLRKAGWQAPAIRNPTERITDLKSAWLRCAIPAPIPSLARYRRPPALTDPFLLRTARCGRPISSANTSPLLIG